MKKPSIDLVFHALGDPSRRAIVKRLSQGPISVARLAEPLAITLAAVVQHLQVLEESGLVQTEKIGRVRTCRIEPAGLSAADEALCADECAGTPLRRSRTPRERPRRRQATRSTQLFC